MNALKPIGAPDDARLVDVLALEMFLRNHGAIGCDHAMTRRELLGAGGFPISGSAHGRERMIRKIVSDAPRCGIAILSNTNGYYVAASIAGTRPAATECDIRRAIEEPILQFFAYAHLPANLQAISGPFSLMAHELVRSLPRNPERTVALRKLLEAKDAAVRAALYKG